MGAVTTVLRALVVAAVASWLAPLKGAVISAQPAGFEVEEHAYLTAPPDKVWQALGQIGAWWLKEHTYSGRSENLSIGLSAGDCLCERWAGGSVRHMVVVLAEPAKILRLEGVLGPLGSLGASGHLTYALKPAGDGGTDLVVTYDVGGWSKDGLAMFAAPVDAVLQAQIESLAHYVEGSRAP